jgi:hypothetical protein
VETLVKEDEDYPVSYLVYVVLALVVIAVSALGSIFFFVDK